MKRKKSKGQGLVEFALILPILLLVVIGTMEFGRIFLIYATVSNAAREGTRYGMVSPADVDGIIARVNDTLVMTLPENLTINVSYDTGPDGISYTNPAGVAVGHRVIVAVQYRVFAMTPFFEPFIPENFMVDVRNARTIQSVKLAITPTLFVPPPSEVPSGEPSVVPSAEPSVVPSVAPTDPETGFTLTPTPVTPTATPTPRPLLPIIIDKPVWANATMVTGKAEPNQVLTLRIVQTGYQLSGIVDAYGNFRFAGLPPLVAGHTIIVQGYGAQDLAVVQAPTPTPTPIATPSGAYIRLNPVCTNAATVTINVTGANWSASAKSLHIFWDSAPTAKVVCGFDNKGNINQPCSFSIYVTEGVPHTVTAISYKSKVGDPAKDQVGIPATAPFVRPCPGAPTPTPTPGTLPDLQIVGIALQNQPPLGTYEKLYVTVGIRNVGNVNVTSLFWVDLFADPTGVLTSQVSVDYMAINAMAAGSTVSFTMYVPNGFKEVGNHTVQAMIDTWNQIRETNEANNISALLPVTLTVSNPAPIPTATPVGTPSPPGNIRGVTYLNGPPQAGVTLYVFAADGRMVASGRSDANGNYLFTNVPAGTYTVVGELTLNGVRYYGQVSQVNVVAGQTATGINIDLVVVP